jgi:Fe2+ transport system protein FeoA
LTDEIENQYHLTMNPLHGPAALPKFAETAASVALHTPATIAGIAEPGALGERLMELGLCPGTPICVVRRGLFGDPVQLAVRGTMLSLRKAQARQVQLLAAPPCPDEPLAPAVVPALRRL